MVVVFGVALRREAEQMTKEKRLSRKYLTYLPSLLSVRDRDLEGYCDNIAEGGLAAFLPEPIPLGSVLLVQFVLPTQPTELHVQVVVRHQFGFQHGLAFLSLSEAERLSAAVG